MKVFLLGQHQVLIPNLDVFLSTTNRNKLQYINDLLENKDVETFAFEKLEEGVIRMKIVLSSVGAYSEITKYLES
jgi:hypothetical protein